jgi:hypothetical protein
MFIIVGADMIETYERKAKFALLEPYDYFSGKDDYIEVTEWKNGEGFDVTFCVKGSEKDYSFTWGQFEALQALVAYKE